MGQNDAIDRLERRLTDDAAASNERNADRLREESARRDADRDFELAVSNRIMPAFKLYTDRLSKRGLSVERPYGRDIQLAVNDRTHGKYSIRYMLVEDGQVLVTKLVMDGNGDVVAKLPLSELTQKQVDGQVEDFVNWYLSLVN